MTNPAAGSNQAAPVSWNRPTPGGDAQQDTDFGFGGVGQDEVVVQRDPDTLLGRRQNRHHDQ